jgi:hypothetical protein
MTRAASCSWCNEPDASTTTFVKRPDTWWFAAGVVVLGLGAWVLVAKRPAPAPCAPRDPFADWTARAAPIAKAFEASGHPVWQSRLDATELGVGE